MTGTSSILETLLDSYKAHRKDQTTKIQGECQECKRISDAALKLYTDNELIEPRDAFHAAILLHHGVENKYVLAANELCRYAIARLDSSDKDMQMARWLYAASYDRILVHDGKPQKFGTQFVKNKDGVFELATSIDLATTDEERALYGIPTVEESLKRLSASYK